MLKLNFIFLLLAFNCKAQDRLCEKSKFDHIVFFVIDSTIEETLDSILTLGDKLTTHHKHQGTISHFYLFYNTYIEFIYPLDTLRIKENSKIFGSEYLKRWSKDTSICKLGVGVINIPFDSTCSNYHTYYSRDSEGYYLMADGNSNSSDVLIYASDSAHRYKSFDSIEDLKWLYPEKYLNDFVNYSTHPSGIKYLTKIEITKPDFAKTTNFESISTFEIISTKPGEQFKYKLIFDRNMRGETIQVNNWLEVAY